MSQDKSVRGHLCEGLKKYQDYSTYGCIPKFDSQGFTRGCDDTNYTHIIYCPFCGEKLPKIKKYKFICDCGKQWESYSKEDDEWCENCYSDVEGVEI